LLDRITDFHCLRRGVANDCYSQRGIATDGKESSPYRELVCLATLDVTPDKQSIVAIGERVPMILRDTLLDTLTRALVAKHRLIEDCRNRSGELKL